MKLHQPDHLLAVREGCAQAPEDRARSHRAATRVARCDDPIGFLASALRLGYVVQQRGREQDSAISRWLRPERGHRSQRLAHHAGVDPDVALRVVHRILGAASQLADPGKGLVDCLPIHLPGWRRWNERKPLPHGPSPKMSSPSVS